MHQVHFRGWQTDGGRLNEMWDPGIEKKNSSGKSGEIQINSVNLIYCTKVDFLAYINIQWLLDINMGGVGKAYTATLCIFCNSSQSKST